MSPLQNSTVKVSGQASPEDPGTASTKSRMQTPFLVGLDGELVRMATGNPGSASFANRGAGLRNGGSEAGEDADSFAQVWGVTSSHSCMVPPGAEVCCWRR